MEALADLALILSDYGPLAAIKAFMYRGGPVLWWLAGLVAVFWVLALERIWYFAVTFQQEQQVWVQQWLQRTDKVSWYAQAQRTRWLDEAEQKLKCHLPMLKLIVMLFPMLGLLGTVTGMISVFDVISLQGSAEPRLMASGISMATLPTMAGMVAALIGMFVFSRLNSVSEKRLVHLERLMRTSATVTA
ncbi:MotA/TolQ/ExbB proton channel family protein [Shewanella youngdeokensis]|uniref:MotA/TolQ/ExbB proton channel family protein n=1 Tax=Shewanella youngdeokensis TaxID=2999068 RepID=A0ABZ0JXW0_9GAMM|nr:MotA/TolQ/ExbB proton channel family protein [Shewanella sp. DAU334]